LNKISLDEYRVIIKGAGDLASGVAHRLARAGFSVLMLELPHPLAVRRSVSFASAVFEGSFEIEGVQASLVDMDDIALIEDCLAQGIIPVCIDQEGVFLNHFTPHVLVDAVMAKRNTGATIHDAPIVIGLGPGFTAGEDVTAVIETQRGHNLGRVIYSGSAAENTGIPGEVGGFAAERLLRAPCAGNFLPCKDLGELVTAGEKIADVGDTPLYASISGLLRGLLYPGAMVQEGTKVGDIDPRGDEVDWRTISDKARSVGGGALEAIMHYLAFYHT